MDVKEYLVKTHHSRRGNMQRRVTAYVDGFNLYFGLRDSGSRKHLWLDPVALIRSLLRPNQHLVALKYFTARLSGGRGRSRDPLHDQREGKRVRQSNYIDALSSLPMVSTYFGHFLDKRQTCRVCRSVWLSPEEKKTDVLIASHMLADAFDGRCEDLVLVSGDGDLAPPISMIRERFPERRVIVAFPPRRYAVELQRTAHAYVEIGMDKVRQSQLPPVVVTSRGHHLRRPPEWQ